MRILAVMGKGGVGKSTIAVALLKWWRTIQSRNAILLQMDRQYNSAVIAEGSGLEPYIFKAPMEKASRLFSTVFEQTGLKQIKAVAELLAEDGLNILALAEFLYPDPMAPKAIRDAEVIILDMPPNHSGLQYLTLPDALSIPLVEWALLRSKAKKMVGKSDMGMDAVQRIKDIILHLKHVFREHIEFIPVTIPTQLGAHEYQALIDFLCKDRADKDMRFIVRPIHPILNMVPQVAHISCHTASCGLGIDIAETEVSCHLIRGYLTRYMLEIPRITAIGRVNAVVDKISEGCANGWAAWPDGGI